jgi:hypothetical protein
MSDDPRQLKKVLIGDATTEDKRQFAEMLANMSAVAEAQERDGLDWLFLPTPTEYAKIEPFTRPPNYDKCPKCGKGRVILTVHHGNVGDSLHLVCKWGDKNCGFKTYISDPL